MFQSTQKEVERKGWYEDQIFCGPITHSHNNNKSNWKPKRSEKSIQEIETVLGEMSEKDDDDDDDANLCV